MTQTSLTYLHPNRYSEELHYYQFTVKLDRGVGNYNTFNDWSNKVFVPSRTEDLNLSVLFNIITGMNELKSLTRIYHVNVNVNLMEESVMQIIGGIMINVDVNVKRHVC